MRIAYLINQYPMVSHVFIRREIQGLERRGIEVMRVALRGWDSQVVDEEDELERERTRYVLQDGAAAMLLALVRMVLTRPLLFLQALLLTWRVGRRAERPLYVHLVYLAEACRIEPWLRTAGVQHMHVHFGTNAAEVAMLLNVLGGPPWSFTVHGPREYDNVQLVGLAEKVRRCAFVVAITSFGRSQLYRLVEHKYWPKIHVVHSGLEPTFHHAAGSSANSSRRLVCVGRICEQKGQLLLIEAAHRLAASGEEFELVLVGDGEMRADIEALIEKYELQATVRITGRISSDRLYSEILASRALVLPSFAEGLPGVIMEAMALKRPVVSTFIAGIPELVHTGKHGWLVPAGDVESLVDAMRTCLNAPLETLIQMGEAAQAQVLARHSTDAQVAAFEDKFRLAVASDPRTA